MIRVLKINFMNGFKTFYKGIFLDRDGVINEDYGYVHKWENFKFCSDVIKGLRILKEYDYKLIIVTNQSGISRKIFSEREYNELTCKYIEYLKKINIKIDGVYHCPHHPLFSPKPFDKCNCRKPKSGLFEKAALEHGINLRESIAIGDKITDMQAAYECGIEKRYLINSRKEMIHKKNKLITDSFENLFEFSNFFKKSNNI